jgi:hypothetical protein
MAHSLLPGKHFIAHRLILIEVPQPDCNDSLHSISLNRSPMNVAAIISLYPMNVCYLIQLNLQQKLIQFLEGFSHND